MDERLLEVLTCPCDVRSDVEYKDRRKVLVCSSCSLQFPVRDGVAVMLMDEAKGTRKIKV